MKAIFRHVLMVPLIAVFLVAASPAAGGEQPGVGTTPGWYYPTLVNAEFVAQYAAIPKREDVLIVDSRPAKKYDKGHIVTAVNIPDRKFDQMTDLLPADKSSLVLFYCGGVKCPLSHKSAFKAEKLGYTNVKVYAAGYPDFIKTHGNIPSVSETYVKKLIDEKSDTLIVDARPAKKFSKGHVPTAVNIPDRKFDQMLDQLPKSKDTPLVFYCGGYKCPLSPKSAAKAEKLGYTKVMLFQAGYPAWKAAFGDAPIQTAVKTDPVKGSMSIETFTRLMREDPDSVYWVDVRDRPEVEVDGTFKTKTSMVVPMDDLEAAIPTLPTDKPIVFFCNKGTRAVDAYDVLQEKGSKLDAYFLEAEVEFHKKDLPRVTAIE